MKRLFFLALSTLLIAAVFAPAAAQDDMEVIADGLRNPRQMSYDADGNLYIAEAGLGGPEVTVNDNPYGASARVTMVAPDGSTEVVVSGLTSYREGDSLGASDVVVTDESIWVLLGESTDPSIPFTTGLVELDRETGRVKTFVDMLTIELEENPDGNDDGASNPVDMVVAEDGTVYVANAGMNALLSWTPADGVQIAASWDSAEDNPVPTAVDIGPDGDIYVGFLTGFPFPPEGSRIERWSGGELVETYPNMTAVTGLLVTEDGTVYATEYGMFDSETFQWEPGRVVTASVDGPAPVMEGLNFPYGLAQAPDGTIVVSINSIGGADGQVIALPGME